MIPFDCPTCAKGLRVKPELAGKKVKCPKCGQAALVPAEAASPAPAAGSATAATLPNATADAPRDLPTPDHVAAPTMPPVDSRTQAPAQKTDTNLANDPHATRAMEPDDNRELSDFLAPPQQPDEIGRLGMYRILKILGAGGMGVVYKAEDPGLKRLVAVKAMLPAIAASAAAKKRFVREAQAAAAIKHNHIVTIFQVGEDRGVPFLAMEFLEGEPLDDRLKREGTLPLPEVLRIGREMAEGMAAAHGRGLIHRDIKPANTWLEASPGRKAGEYSVKILDFGLARSTTDDSHLTQSGAIVGTPAYMAPEQGRGEKLDGRCDLWSLGVVLYRMCTGEMPFKGNDTVSTLLSVATNTPSPPAKINAKIPPGLSDVIMKLLEKDPANRTASAHEVAETLRDLEAGVPALAGPNANRLKAGLQQSAEAGVPTLAGPNANRLKAGLQQSAVDTIALEPKQPSGRNKSRLPILLALAGGVAAAVTAVIVLFWTTPVGLVRIESDDPAVTVVFDKDSAMIKGADKETIRLKPGEHGMLITRGDFSFEANKFTLKKGDMITLKLDFLKGKLELARDGQVFDAKDFAPQGKGADPLPIGAKSPPRNRYALSMDVKSRVSFPRLKVDLSSPVTIEGYFTQSKHAGLACPMTLLNRVWINGAQSPGKSWGLGLWGAKTQYALGSTANTGDTPVLLNQKTHVAGVFDGHEARLYVNGKLTAKKDIGKDSPLKFEKSNLYFGYEFVGLLHEVRVSKVARYDKEFTPAQRFEPDADTLALYHFDEGAGTVVNDSSGHGNHGDIARDLGEGDGSPIPELPPGDFALRFDEKSRVNFFNFEVLKVDLTRPLTIEGHFTPSECKASSVSIWTNVLFNLQGGNGKEWRFLIYKTAAGHWAASSRTLGVAGRKTHVAGVFTGKQMRVFVDGKLLGVQDIDKDKVRTDALPLNLGANQGYFGLMKEIRISRAARYDKDFTPAVRFETDADTLALYHFDEGGSDVLKDSSGNGYHGKIVDATWVMADGSPIVAVTKTAEPVKQPANPPVAGTNFTNSLGMEFALVPKGKSWLGGGGDKPGTKEVNMAQEFYLGVYEVTQEEWLKIMDKNPSGFNRKSVGNEIGDDELMRFPVENVTWDEAKTFIKRVNDKAKTDDKEAGWEYQLPTEEQWEYACRGGPMTDKAESAFDYYFEKPSLTMSKDQANFAASGLKRPRKVGSYAPNKLGLYDMHGNVWEWCADRHDKDDTLRVFRDGGWSLEARACRAASRGGRHPEGRRSDLGFRLARVPVGTGKQ